MVNPDLVLQESGDPQGPTHSKPAECGSRLFRLGQIIQTVWSLLSEAFQLIWKMWHQPQINLFRTRFNKKFVSPVPDSIAWAVDTLSLPWEELDQYAFPPVTILSKVVAKLRDYLYRIIILIAPGWPDMFWDLVAMSSQIPLCLPNVLTPPFYCATIAYHEGLDAISGGCRHSG